MLRAASEIQKGLLRLVTSGVQYRDVDVVQIGRDLKLVLRCRPRHRPPCRRDRLNGLPLRGIAGADRHREPALGGVPAIPRQLFLLVERHLEHRQFGAAQILLQEREGMTRMFVRPSFAGYVVDLLVAASEP